ncbi:hypothetical protein [Brevundimonas sp. PAMC22021]|uniref:hypothetical protein n=1 Tax=Brevundimonas sp. PAMC22021 TaxID=2861285 RepID=UPI001C626AD1|nr:hypothetical protein [Brevundimonas sp. PAMC22021]QYF86843.1 hypothetical protein KY493_13705 [Brevundimonas sp. PAMC22021]
MRRLTALALSLAAAAAVHAPVKAQGPTRTAASEPAGRQTVMICASDNATRRAYQREHGSAPVFVTAREVMDAQRAGEAWSKPRCMNEQEYRRLILLANTRASL